MDVLEFVKIYFDGEAVGVKEIGAGRLAGRKRYEGLLKQAIRRGETGWHVLV